MTVTTRTRVRRALVLFVLLSLPCAPVALAGGFTGLVIFGDSLSDPGNHFIAFGTVEQRPFVPIPADSYAIGGHHFSNGATWAEQLAERLHLPTSGRPALRVPGVFTNYAVGRARARPGAPVFPFHDLGTQVGRFLSDFGGYASPDNLYVIWIGANDVSDALEALADPGHGAASADAIIERAISAVADNIQALWVSGARTFLILNMPNPAATPALRALGPAAQAAATRLTVAYNSALDEALAPTALGALPQIRFVRLDVDAVFDEVVAAPRAAGVTNVTDPCLTFGVIRGAICATPNRYLFWDGIHPTTAAHAILAEAAFLALTP